MAHPLYPVARKLVGKHVYAYHLSGKVYPGILQNVTQKGIYLLPMNHASYLKKIDSSDEWVKLSDRTTQADVSLVYSPAGFLAFGALSGLTLGALASRPPYYGGYGYGYGPGGYGGYGAGGYGPGGYSGYGGYGASPFMW